MWFVWLIAGLVAGAALMAVVARWQVRRALAKQQVAEKRARAAERLAEIGGLTSGLAHEIKNPLSTIGLNAQLLGEAIDDLSRESPVTDTERQRLQRRIATLRREVERLRGILQDFLNYAGELRLDKQPTDVHRVIDELSDFFMPQAQSQGVRLRADLSSDEARVPLDVGHFKQAMLNLMLNGVQAMQGGTGSKELIIRTVPQKNASGAFAGVQIHVIDTGPGIPADVVSKMFTPYFTTKAGGSGLGLPTTRRIIEAHGGRLEVFTDAGKGTDFVVTLPAEQSA
ncbi:MAG TPA: ATP-binding protein [Phycisphaerales bacterium]|nr:ATP-binding protein [Phycisphaerales bacterium]